MARLKNGILGGVSGKIGNVVGSNWKGIDYVKSLPSQYNDAKTEVQILNRTKFQTVVKFLQPLLEVIRIGFNSLAVKKTAFNAATSYTYHNALIGDYPDVSIDFSKVMISKGGLRGVENAIAASTEAGKLELTWSDNSALGFANANDVAMIVVYHPELEDAYYTLNGANRADAALVLDLPQSYSGSEVHVYMGFMALTGSQSAAKKSISNSQYLGAVTIA